LGGNLRQAIAALKQLKQADINLNEHVETIAEALAANEKLTHCWSEFKDTLHPQTVPDEYGQERPISWRATVPAEAFFNAETLVAVELKTEYFKHQPGILTGVGIIGTFVGLLRGLANFSVSSDPEKVRVSLDALIHGVQEAFLMSACAIGLAMLTTLIEKLIVTARIKQVEELCQLLDSLFQSGAGEEYLARLVKAGESSATQTAHLKDALVSDLKTMLSELIEQQGKEIAVSFNKSSQESSGQIATAISDGLTEPMRRIAAAVNTTTDNNGEVVSRALNEALITFSQKMEDMFGGQMGGMNELLQQTTTAMQTTVSRFDELAGNLGKAGTDAADAMAERINLALQAMEARQQTLSVTMTEFVNQLRELVQTSQTETNQQLQHTLAMLGEKIAAMTEQLQYQATATADHHQMQQDKLQQNAALQTQELANQVQTSLATMQQHMANLMTLMQEQTQQTAAANTEQQQQLAQHTQAAVNALSSKLESSIEATNTQAKSTQMTLQHQLETMVEALKENTVQTASIQNGQQRRFLDNIETALLKTHSQVENNVKELQQTVNDFAKLMAGQSEQMNQNQQLANKQLGEQTAQVVEQLRQQLQAMILQTNTAASAMQSAVASMRDVTKDNTLRMETSAGVLSLAAEQFAKAGHDVNGIMQQTNAATGKLANTATALNTAANTVQTALVDYQKAGQTLGPMVEALKAIVETAKKEASVSQTLVNQIQQSTQQLLQAQSSVDGIFQAVCDELANAHQAFADNVVQGLKTSNTAYQKELQTAVDYLKSAIRDLGDLVDELPKS